MKAYYFHSIFAKIKANVAFFSPRYSELQPFVILYQHHLIANWLRLLELTLSQGPPTAVASLLKIT
jgi:hypothetical protein